MKKYTISRKQTLTLASVVLGTVFTGTTIASADDIAPATTQAAPAALPPKRNNSSIQCSRQSINRWTAGDTFFREGHTEGNKALRTEWNLRHFFFPVSCNHSLVRADSQASLDHLMVVKSSLVVNRVCKVSPSCLIKRSWSVSWPGKVWIKSSVSKSFISY